MSANASLNVDLDPDPHPDPHPDPDLDLDLGLQLNEQHGSEEKDPSVGVMHSLEAALARKTVECEEYGRRVDELEEEVIYLRRELATREMVGNVDSSLHKDDVLQKLCDIVLLAEAMWKKIKTLQLQQVLRSKAMKRLYASEGDGEVNGVKGLHRREGGREMMKERGDDDDADPLKPLQEVNKELRELRSGVIEMFLEYFRSEEAERDYRRKGTNMLQRLSDLVFESCEHLVAKQQEVNDYAEALLRPVVERDREFRKESMQEHSQGPDTEDDLLDFALGEDEKEAYELQLPEIDQDLKVDDEDDDEDEAEAEEYELRATISTAISSITAAQLDT